MNIWCISKYACLPKYGIGARLFYLAQEFQKAGHKTILFTSDANHNALFPATSQRYNSETVKDVDVHWIKTKKYEKSASVSRVVSWLDFEIGLFRMDRKELQAPDVLIVSSLSLLSIIYGYYLKKKYKAFLVFEVRDIWPLTMVAEGGFSRIHPLVVLLAAVEKFGYKKSDLIVGTMPRLDIHVRKILKYERPFFCSPLGFDANDKKGVQVNSDDLADYFPYDKTIVGYAGSMGTSNPLESLMSCIELLRERADIHFVLVGSGDLKSEYENRMSENSNVTFMSRISEKMIPKFLKHCDILYLATHNSEVWDYGQSMNKLVDYMRSGKPIVASYSGYQSMLNEANSGVFVPSNDANKLKEAIEDFVNMEQHARLEIGENGKKWINQNRTYSKLAKSYLRELERLVCR
ncbi:MAG: glycosyltransferase [Pseudomonadales bacterium]|nr:glycosyltransferase [Pseudomonadales bacterium]